MSRKSQSPVVCHRRIGFIRKNIIASRTTRLFGGNRDGYGGDYFDDDEDDETDDHDNLSSSLGDWREFRARLVQGEMNINNSEGDDDEDDIQKATKQQRGGQPTTLSFKSPSKSNRNNNSNNNSNNNNSKDWAYDCTSNDSSTPNIEVGSIILSRSEQDFSYGLKQQYFHKSVILVIEHTPPAQTKTKNEHCNDNGDGNDGFIKGIILNRPTNLILTDEDFVYDDGTSLLLTDTNSDDDDDDDDYTIIDDSHVQNDNQWHMWFGGDVQGIASSNPDIVCLHTLLSDNKTTKEEAKTNTKDNRQLQQEKQIIQYFSKPIIDDEIQYTTLEGARHLISQGIAKSTDFYVYCGYSGWNYKQIHNELQRKSWYVIQSSVSVIQNQLLHHKNKQHQLNNKLQQLHIKEQELQFIVDSISSNGKEKKKKKNNKKKKDKQQQEEQQQQEQQQERRRRQQQQIQNQIDKYKFNPTNYIGLDFWEELMIMINHDHKEQIKDTIGEFDDLMLYEWANENLDFDYTTTTTTTTTITETTTTTTATSSGWLVDEDDDDDDNNDDDVLDTVIHYYDDKGDDDDDDNDNAKNKNNNHDWDDDLRKLVQKNKEKERTKDSFSSSTTDEIQRTTNKEQPLYAVGDIIRGSSMERSPFLLSDQEYHKSIILIIKDNDQLTIGLILNQPLPKDVKFYLHAGASQDDNNINVKEKDNRITTIQTTMKRIPKRYGGKYGIKTTSNNGNNSNKSTRDKDEHGSSSGKEENTKPYVWLHCNNNVLKEAHIGEPIGSGPVNFGWGVWQCTREDAYKAIKMGYATIQDFMVVKGFTVWEKQKHPRDVRNEKKKKENKSKHYDDDDDDDEDNDFDYYDYYNNNNDLSRAITNGLFERVPTTRIRDIWKILSNQERLSTKSIDKNIMLLNDAWNVAGTEEEVLVKDSLLTTKRTSSSTGAATNSNKKQNSKATTKITTMPIQTHQNQQQNEQQQRQQQSEEDSPSSSTSSSSSSPVTTKTTTTTTNVKKQQQIDDIDNNDERSSSSAHASSSSSVSNNTNNKMKSDGLKITNLCDDALRCWIAAYLLGKPVLRKTHNTQFG